MRTTKAKAGKRSPVIVIPQPKVATQMLRAEIRRAPGRAIDPDWNNTLRDLAEFGRLLAGAEAERQP